MTVAGARSGTPSPEPSDADGSPKTEGVPWIAVVVLSFLLSAADAFWLVTVQGAVGAIERTRHPFGVWVVLTLLGFPLLVLAVRASFGLVRRRRGHLRGAGTLLAATAAVAVAGTLVGVAGLVASAAWDYSLQVDQLAASAAMPGRDGRDAMAAMPGMDMSGCDMECQAEQRTFDTQVRAVGLAAPLVLISDLVLAGWVVAALGGRWEPEP